MSFKAILYAYVLGGLTFIPLLLASLVLFTIYTSVPVGDLDVSKKRKSVLEGRLQEEDADTAPELAAPTIGDINDLPKTRKGWLTMRRTFEESAFDGGYVTLVRSFLDARSKDPKRSRPKDMWYVVLKGKILYLYEDEGMTECEAVIQLGAHDVIIYPEGLLDGELFTKRNAICLQPKGSNADNGMPSVTKAMKLDEDDVGKGSEDAETSTKAVETTTEAEKLKTLAAKEEAIDSNTPWFIFVRSNVEMEDWYLSLIHASDHPAQTHHLSPLQAIFLPSDMNLLVTTLDEQPDVIPMRWLNALVGRIFYSFYKTHLLEAFIIGRLMKKLSKIKRPTFLADIVVTQVSVGNTAPTFSKPMLKELTKEGDASLEIHLLYKGEVRLTVEATANINLGTFKSYNVKLVLAVVLKEIEGNLLVKVKRPPSNRIWYAFTQMPRMVLEVEPIVSDRQITWTMVLSTIESRLKEVIQESVVLPNMDDIAFFESLSHQHRGGIWPDAARRVGPQRVPDQSSKDTGTEIDAVEAPTETEQVPLLQKATSLQERTTSSTEPPLMTLSSTEPSFSEESSPLNRRRTWFSTSRNDEKLLSDDRENTTAKDDEARGRSVDVGKITLARSHSAPGEPEVNRIGDGSDDDSGSNPQSHLSVNDGRRSPSRASSTSDNQGNGPSSVSRSSSRSHKVLPPSPSPEPTRVPPASPSATSSFLSTLKSKAGDKQALSNSAKETMRKWGVNWSNLRKGTTGNGDEMPDHGPVDSQERPASTSSLSHKARTSYAEVRAAVAERLRGGEEPRPSSAPDTLSRTRTVSSSMLAPAQSSSQRDHEPDISDSVLSPDDAPENPIHVQPQAKTMSIPGIHASHRGNVMSMGYVAPPISPPPESKKNPVLRLWKSPVLSGSTDSSVAMSLPEGNKSVESLEPPPPLNNVPIPRPPPPALPPRPSVTRPPVQHTRVASDISAQSASDSLKSIVDKEEKRTGRPSISDPTPPPPPPPNPDPNVTETISLSPIEIASS